MNIQDTPVNKSNSEAFLKRLLELSIKSLGEIPILEDPNEEQEEFMKRKIFRNDNKQ